MAIASHITLGNAKNTLLQKISQIQSIGHFLGVVMVTGALQRVMWQLIVLQVQLNL